MDNADVLNKLFRKYISKRVMRHHGECFDVSFRVNLKVHRPYNGNIKGIIKANIVLTSLCRREVSHNRPWGIYEREMLKKKDVSPIFRAWIRSLVQHHNSKTMELLKYFVEVDKYIIKSERISWRELDKSVSL